MGMPSHYQTWLESRDDEAFSEILGAAEMVLEIQQALANDGLSILNELFRDLPEGPIEQWVHYPQDDARDPDSGAMFYYHAHDPAERPADEHGHFHLFVRPAAMGPFSHFVALSMTANGELRSAFTTNRWVTDETLLPAQSLLALVRERFEINRARPSWLVAQWLMAMIILLQPFLEQLLVERDRALGWTADEEPGEAMVEDRDRHVLSEMEIDLPGLLATVQTVAAERLAVEF